jgi:cytochrome c556
MRVARPVRLSLLVITVAAVLGCPTQTTPESIETKKNPTTATMHRLATELGGLEDTLAVSALDAAAVERAITSLNGLAVRAKGLEGTSKAHPLVKEGMPSFVADIEAARAALQQQPPDAEPARMLARSCRACHALAALPPSSPSSSALAQR